MSSSATSNAAKSLSAPADAPTPHHVSTNTAASGARCCDPTPPSGARLVQIRDNLLDRIAEAHHEGWLGEVDGLNVSLAAARSKLTQLGALAARTQPVNIGMPSRPE